MRSFSPSAPIDWVLSFSAVSASLLLTTPAAVNAFISETVVTTLMLTGLLLQTSGKLALGRSFGLMPANRAVKTRGLDPAHFVIAKDWATGPRLPIDYRPNGNSIDYTVLVKGQSFTVRKRRRWAFSRARCPFRREKIARLRCATRKMVQQADLIAEMVELDVEF